MTALELLAQAAIMAVVALGAWVAMGEGMILAPLREWAERTNAPALVMPDDKSHYIHLWPAWIRNPLTACPRCMCSAWGIAALIICGFGVGVSWNFELYILVIDWQRVAQLPVLILAAVGIQEMLHRP